MLISPQHLQQLDRYHEALLEERFATALPHTTGVYALEFDSLALEEGVFALRTLHAVLPRGTVISLAAGDVEMPAPRTIAEHFTSVQERLGVYVGLQLERDGTTAFSTDVARGRYGIERRSVTDLVEGHPLVVEFARRNLRILFSGEERADSECIKVAELKRTETGGFEVIEAYVPPCLRTGASPYLQKELARILGLAVLRQRGLSEERSQREGGSAEYSAADITRFLLLNAVNTTIPLLRHASDSGELSPQHVYLMLIQLAGQLCTFGAREDPASLPAYHPNDLRETFEPLFERLTVLLQTRLTSRHVRIPLESREDGLHLAKLRDEQILREGVRFVLSVTTALEQSIVSTRIPQLAKVGSWAKITQMVNNAVPGAIVRFEAHPPPEVPLKPGRVFFSVDISSQHWREVLRDRTVAVHLPPPFDPKAVSLELMAIPAA